MLEFNNIYNIDCLEGMKDIPDKSIDCIITDLPYGSIRMSWDCVIPLDKLWHQWNRILVDNGTVLLFGSEPFSTKLRMAALDKFKYDWIWHKPYTTGFQHAKNMPLKDYEIISVFSKGKMNHKKLSGDMRMIYNPQGVKKCDKVIHAGDSKFGTVTTEYKSAKKQYHVNEENYPRMILEGYGREPDSWHPTQKNVALVAYLIRTYTNVGGRILDCCMGSDTTAVAAIRTNRNFIGFELNKEYFDKAVMRIEKEKLMKETDLFGYGDLLSEKL